MKEQMTKQIVAMDSLIRQYRSERNELIAAIKAMREAEPAVASTAKLAALYELVNRIEGGESCR